MSVIALGSPLTDERRAAMRVLRGAAALLGLIGLGIGLTACVGAASLRTADVEEQIATGLADSVTGEFDVTCPADVPAEKGYTFTCTVADVTGGTTISVTVIEDDDQGTFTWRVSAPG